MLASLASRQVAAFPVRRAGRLPHCSFRSLLSVHSRCSPHGRRAARGGLVTSECFRPCRYLHHPLRLLPAGATVAGRDSHPLGDGAFPRRTNRHQLSVHLAVSGHLLRQAKPWRGGCDDLKPLVAIQRVRLPPGKGAARQPEASLAWRAATPVVKRRQQVTKRRAASKSQMMTPSLLSVCGQYRKRRYWRGATGRPGSWTGAKSRDGSPGNLGDPALARGQRGWKRDGQREQSRPRPVAGPARRRERPQGGHEPRQAPAEPAGEINKPKDMQEQEVVAL